MFLSIILGLLFLALPVVVIVLAVRHFATRPSDGRGVRRFFQYLLLYVLVVLAATGLAELIGRIWDPVVAEAGAVGLARALTFTLFGIPLVALLGAWTSRLLRRDHEEAAALGWLLYVTAASVTALIVAIVAFVEAAGGLLSGDFVGQGVAPLLVWGAVWGGHWVLLNRLLPVRRRQLPVAAGSLTGLVTVIIGLIRLLGEALGELAFQPLVELGAASPLVEPAAIAVVGAAVWSGYWLGRYAAAERIPGWFGYVLPFAVGGSLVVALVGATVLVYQVLVWFAGDAPRAEAHFAGAPFAGAAVLVGGVSWWYHRGVVRQARTGRTEADRVYEYLMSAIALIAATTGVALALMSLIDGAAAGDVVVGSGDALRNQLLLAVTLLGIGGGLWWAFWRQVERLAADPGELTLTRRLYLSVLFGVGGVVAVGGLLTAAFIGLQDAIEGDLGERTLSEMSVPLALLLTSGAVSGYHWAVHRRDRRLAPEASRRRPRHLVLVGLDSGVAAQVREATGDTVEVWSSATVSPSSAAEVLAALAQAPGETVLLVAGPEGLRAVPVTHRARL